MLSGVARDPGLSPLTASHASPSPKSECQEWRRDAAIRIMTRLTSLASRSMWSVGFSAEFPQRILRAATPTLYGRAGNISRPDRDIRLFPAGTARKYRMSGTGATRPVLK